MYYENINTCVHIHNRFCAHTSTRWKITRNKKQEDLLCRDKLIDMTGDLKLTFLANQSGARPTRLINAKCTLTILKLPWPGQGTSQKPFPHSLQRDLTNE